MLFYGFVNYLYNTNKKKANLKAMPYKMKYVIELIETILNVKILHKF